jgi:hypothetical protein
LTPELNFGFWVTMMKHYDRIIWHNYIEEIFPDAPKSYNFERNKSTIRENLIKIKKLRNRIFHHEPIFCPIQLSFVNLLENYENTIELMGWLSQDVLVTFEESNNKFINLIAFIPSNMKKLE